MIYYLATNKIVGAVSGLPRDVIQYVGETRELAHVFRYRPSSNIPSNPAIRALVALDREVQDWVLQATFSVPALAALAVQRSEVSLFANTLAWEGLTIEAGDLTGDLETPVWLNSQVLEGVLGYIQGHWGDPDGTVTVTMSGRGPAHPVRVQPLDPHSDPDALARYYIAPLFVSGKKEE